MFSGPKTKDWTFSGTIPPCLSRPRQHVKAGHRTSTRHQLPRSFSANPSFPGSARGNGRRSRLHPGFCPGRLNF
ncbi:hypothetical protein N656DRAFT_359278 [Canariomyces notabilis]|uniref:Uncharacterized protein n=1 Tax=Canariomyces notabilis TaxID=2074819 RepID=A0AAN6QLY1_9PEZI|nr:hypothetical protein N656DRAFT_359278 [Canariomyces arenarius]